MSDKVFHIEGEPSLNRRLVAQSTNAQGELTGRVGARLTRVGGDDGELLLIRFMVVSIATGVPMACFPAVPIVEDHPIGLVGAHAYTDSDVHEGRPFSLTAHLSDGVVALLLSWDGDDSSLSITGDSVGVKDGRQFDLLIDRYRFVFSGHD